MGARKQGLSITELLAFLLREKYIVQVDEDKYVLTDKLNKSAIPNDVSMTLEEAYDKFYSNVPYRIHSNGGNRTVRYRFKDDVKVFKQSVYDPLVVKANGSDNEFKKLFEQTLAGVRMYYATEAYPVGIERLIKEKRYQEDGSTSGNNVGTRDTPFEL